METMVWITENPLNVISFGIATYEFCKRMPNYRVIVLALGHEGVPLRPTQNFEILPLKSSEQLDYYMRKLSPEVTIVFHSYYFIKSIENISLCGKKLVYVPVEGDPLPMEVVPTLQTYDQIITP